MTQTPECQRIVEPPRHPILGHIRWLKREPIALLEDAAEQFGDLVQIRIAGYRMLIASHPRFVRLVLDEQADGFEKPRRFRKACRPFFGDGLFAASNEQVRRARKRLHQSVPSFDPASTKANLHKAMDRWIERLGNDINTLDSRALFELIFDVRLRPLVGHEFADQSETIATCIDAFMNGFVRRMTHPVGGWLFFLKREEREFREARRTWWRFVDQITKAVIAKTGFAPSSRVDRRSPEFIERRDSLATWILTGAETISNTLTFAFALLAENDSLQDEIRSCTGSTDEASGSGDNLKMSNGLVSRCLKETMRLYPQAFMIGRKAIRTFACDGMTFGRGTTVFLNMWSMGRDRRWFDDGEHFRPQRWQQDSLNEWKDFAAIPFGLGPRQCVGMQTAMIEMVEIIDRVIRTVQLSEGSGRLPPKAALTLRPDNRMNIAVCRRVESAILRQP